MLESVESQSTEELEEIFKGYQGPAFSILLWDGRRWRSPGTGSTACTIVFRSADALRSLIVQASEVTLGEAFLSKAIDVEGDIFSVFAIAEYVFQRPESQRRRILEFIAGVLSRIGQRWKQGKLHSMGRDRAAISYHYDQPVDFYEPWLGPSLAYSCAYFQSADDPIDVAQTNKLELICRKLRLQPRDRFLDIGCGWGSLVLHAGSRHNAYAEGITLSREQASVATARIAAARLTQSCKVELLDYRKATSRLESFDKIASVGMFEHVGLKNLPLYFQIAHRLLKPGGVFLNHGIARSHSQRTRRSSFMDKHVFPDGELATISEALSAAESAGFEVRDVENLREHYELTLRFWVEGIKENADTLLKLVSEATYRTWLLYMAGSAAAFRRGDIGLYQVLLSRPDMGNSKLPFTREDWYSSSLSSEEAKV